MTQRFHPNQVRKASLKYYILLFAKRIPVISCTQQRSRGSLLACVLVGAQRGCFARGQHCPNLPLLESPVQTRPAGE